ncbi:MAG: DnaD domain protein [Clostridia bacterium]|nr:DnaD domain protein [Clostridia bacterium]
MYHIVKKESHTNMELPTVFVDRYMPSARPAFVKIYLMGLRQCYTSKPKGNKEIAQELGLLESEVIEAWKYWAQQGIIRLKQNEGGGYEVEFLDLSNARTEPYVRTETKPTYTSDEICDRAEDDANLQHMFTQVSKMLGKPLSTVEAETLFGFYDWLRLPIDVIILLVSYCVSIGKKNMRYIEKVALNWADQDINTYEKAEQNLKQMQESNVKINRVKKIMGIYDRQLQEPELLHIKKWLYEFQMPVEMIQFACEKCALNTGKLSIPYITGILEKWHDKGIKTLQAAKEEGDAHQQKKSEKNSSGKPQNKGTKFTNFKQDKLDFSDIERRALVRKNNAEG